jgi:hypothetical protein
MPESVEYKIIQGNLPSIEKEANEMAAQGWRVVSSISLAQWEYGLVLERPIHV